MAVVLGYVALVCAATLSGCASLSKSQIASVEKLSVSCDSFAKYPSALFVQIAEIRSERGCYYTASLSDPLLRVKELNSLEKARKSDLALAKKMDASLEILRAYQRSLKSLSSAERYNSTGREFRSLGRGLDSLISRYNLMNIADPLPLGIGKAIGKIVGYGAELYLRNVQAKALREFVVEGDSLVMAVTSNLIGILSSDPVRELIDNEISGLEINYVSYLRSGGGDFTGDKEYLALLHKSGNLQTLRSGTVSAAKSLSKAHNKLASEIVKRKKIKQLYAEIRELDDELYSLKTLLDKF